MHQNNINRITCIKITLIKYISKIFFKDNLSNDNIFKIYQALCTGNISIDLVLEAINVLFVQTIHLFEIFYMIE